MRKLIAFLLAAGLVFVFSAPAPAADKTVEERLKALEDTIGTWTFYGSARMATFYEKANSDLINDQLLDAETDLSYPDEKTTRWGLAGNSRIGAKVIKGNFGGRFEIGFKEGQALGVRLLYGTYTFNDVTILWGQDYTPLDDWDYSNQVFAWDNDLAGWGVLDESVNGPRVPQVKIIYKGFQLALVENAGLPVGGLTADDVKTEIVLPHLEARYTLTLNDKFTGDIFGGANTYKVKSESLKIDKSISSYALGVGGKCTLDPVFVNAMLWYAENGRNLGLHQADAAGAIIDPTTGDITKDKDFGGALIIGANIQKVTVEAGYGYVRSKNDAAGSDKNDAQNYYLQAVIPVAAANGAKLSITPEIGVYDYKKDATGVAEGKATYAGAKWQLDF